jgi:hypothetical protein
MDDLQGSYDSAKLLIATGSDTEHGILRRNADDPDSPL